MNHRVLVLEDDESLRLVISRALVRAGFDVRATASPSAAIERMARRDADLLVADALLGDENFLDRLGEVSRLRPDAPVLVISAQTTAGTAIKAVAGGAFEYLPKPFDLDDLVAAVSRALKTAPAPSRPVAVPSAPFAELLGRSPAMQETFQILGRLARSAVPVLFTGPEGSGRASAARTLHRARDNGRGDLIEAGPARLAREGADLFAAAAGGGLLLRRAERWSDAAQDVVLEHLEGVDPARTGPNAPRLYATGAVNAREALMPALFEKLAIGHVRIPPLRERGEDSLIVFEHFLKRHAPGLDPDADARDFVRAHGWPGEVAQMERVARRLGAQGRPDRIGLADLQAILERDGGEDAADALYQAAALFAGEKIAQGSASPADEAAAIIDRALIETALALTGGVRRDAAARLGLNRNTLARRLAALGLTAENED